MGVGAFVTIGLFFKVKAGYQTNPEAYRSVGVVFSSYRGLRHAGLHVQTYRVIEGWDPWKDSVCRQIVREVRC